MRSGSWNSSRSISLCGMREDVGNVEPVDRSGLHADGSDQHQPAHTFRRLGREFGGDPAADRTADHVDLRQAQPVHQFQIDVGDVVHRIDPVGQAGFAEARMRWRDQAVPRRQQAAHRDARARSPAHCAGTGRAGRRHPRTGRVRRRRPRLFRGARDVLQVWLPEASRNCGRGHAGVVHRGVQSVSASLPIENTAPVLTSTFFTTQLRPVLSVNLTS